MISAAAVPAGWEGILEAGEQILWQGRPGQAFHIGFEDLFKGVFGLFFAGFAAFWMAMAMTAGGFFWMFGLLHFGAGLALVFGSLLGPTIRRRNTWYTLTDRRAFIATDMPLKSRSLKSYPIGPDTALAYYDGDPATIHFAREQRRTDKGRGYTVDIGFERISEGDKVLRLMHGVKDRLQDAPAGAEA